VLRRIKFVADAKEIIRSIAISTVAIALGVYALVVQPHSLATIVIAALVLGMIAGATLQVIRAVNQLHRKGKDLEQASQRAERHYFKVLRRILTTMEARDPMTRGRSKRISRLARRMARRMQLPHQQCRLVSLAAQVQDIGLLAVPEAILHKPARIGSTEFRGLQRHAEISYRILEPLKFLADILPAVKYHHERMNGTGYPFELRGQQIPLEARILAVADAYDAMTHDRPQRPGLSPYDALNELHRCTPAGYDPAVVSALEEILHGPHLRRVLEPDALQPSAETRPAVAKMAEMAGA